VASPIGRREKGRFQMFRTLMTASLNRAPAAQIELEVGKAA
jgi:hypothetical protein